MERIASFSIDHTRLQPGMYLSRRDGTVVTLDLRFRRPNTDIVELLKRAFNEAAAWDKEMPGQSPYECGNYRNLDVAVCRKECAYYAQVIKDWTVDKLEYEFRL